jgi:hypothetical protein
MKMANHKAKHAAHFVTLLCATLNCLANGATRLGGLWVQTVCAHGDPECFSLLSTAVVVQHAGPTQNCFNNTTMSVCSFANNDSMLNNSYNANHALLISSQLHNKPREFKG